MSSPRWAVFALFLMSATCGLGQESTAESVQVGDSIDQVKAAKGTPSSVMALGETQVLTYPDMMVKVNAGVVTRVTPIKRPVPTPTRAPESASPAANGGVPAFVMQEDDVEKGIDVFQKRVRQDFIDENFSELEAIASQAIDRKEVFGDGTWKITRLEGAVDFYGQAPDEKWSQWEQKYYRWTDKFPGSVTAKASQVEFLCGFAWHARGTGWAKDVTPEAWELFKNRMAQAYIVYMTAEKLPQKSPGLFWAAFPIALGQSWPVAEVVKAFARDREAEPTFWENDGAMANFLLPRWYGANGDWERFAKQVSMLKGGLGTEEYAWTVWSVYAYYPKGVFAETAAEWPLVQDGYRRILKQYPRSNQLLNQYAALAVQAGDRATAREEFDAMHGVADPQVFTQKWLNGCLEWTYNPK